MNVGKGHNVFSDIPGFDATKGERIVKSLQRLWAKIEQLEQIRISERQNRSKEVQTSSNEEELSITDVQYKLLRLQLQYARDIIRKKFSNACAAGDQGPANQTEYELTGNKDSLSGDHILQQPAFQTVNQETQTGNTLLEGINLDINEFEKNTEASSAQVSTDTQYDDGKQSAHLRGRTIFTSSTPHYHLKLDDVPFILGASSTASHSVVANVQNIIAMMKTHNKALCGPRHNPKVPVSKSHIPVENPGDTSQMLKKLSQDLHDLTQKQKILAQRFDSAEKRNASIPSVYDRDDADKKGEQKISNRGHKRIHSSCDQAKIEAEMNMPRPRAKEGNYGQGQRLTAKNHSSNLSIMARRKLLRSLQNFKSHLSEEDISWE